jgi:putative methylase
VHLEQYPTGAHLAACVLHAAAERDDVDGRVVVDLGVGGGVLGIAASMMGAKRVVGVDVDPAAIELARENCDAFDPPIEIELRLGKVPRDVDAWSARGRREEEEEEEDLETATPSSSDASDPNRALRADTVVMNPPFGTRRKGADMGFLRAALGVTRRGGAVYSLHKSSTRAHVERHALVVLRAKSAEVLAELRYELPRVYSHHRRDAVDIEVDLWRFEPPEDGVVGGGRGATRRTKKTTRRPTTTTTTAATTTTTISIRREGRPREEKTRQSSFVTRIRCPSARGSRT